MNFSLRPGFVCVLTSVSQEPFVQLCLVQDADLMGLLKGLNQGNRVACSAFFMDAPAAWAQLSQELGLSQPQTPRPLDLEAACEALSRLGQQDAQVKQELQKVCAFMSSVGEFSLDELELPSHPVVKGSALDKLLHHVVAPEDGRTVRALLSKVWGSKENTCAQELTMLRSVGLMVCPQEGLALLDKRPGHALEQVFTARLGVAQWAQAMAPVAGLTPDFRVVSLQAWLDRTLAGPELVDCVSPL